MNTTMANENLKMSIIILAPDCYATIRQTMRCLAAQTRRDQLEIVVVTQSANSLNDDAGELRAFNHQVIEVDQIESTAAARAIGVHHARAPIVALAEDHSFPAPDWAEALLARHEEAWAAVGPAVGNANPRSALSWANLAIEYGPWLHPAEPGPMEHLPGHNSSYKRDLLLSYGARLEAMLEAESVLHWDLRRQGHQLYLEPSAKTFHLNYSLLGSTIPLRFLGGRMFAAARARPWSILRRLVYATGSPLIPIVRLRRILLDLRRTGQLSGLMPRILPLAALALTADAIGELVGYLFGGGEAMSALTEMEFHRYRFMNRADLDAGGVNQHSVAAVE